jgi:hypothetical protein
MAAMVGTDTSAPSANIRQLTPPAAQGMHERRRIHDLGFLRHDQIRTAGELVPSGILCQCRAYRRTLAQVFVGIDMDDLIERTELGMPEGPQFRVFLPQGEPLGKAFFKFGHGPGAEGIGADFVQHWRILQMTGGWRGNCQQICRTFGTL